MLIEDFEVVIHQWGYTARRGDPGVAIMINKGTKQTFFIKKAPVYTYQCKDDQFNIIAIYLFEDPKDDKVVDNILVSIACLRESEGETAEFRIDLYGVPVPYFLEECHLFANVFDDIPMDVKGERHRILWEEGVTLQSVIESLFYPK